MVCVDLRDRDPRALDVTRRRAAIDRRMPPRDLRLVRIAIAVLREQHPVRRDRDERVAHVADATVPRGSRNPGLRGPRWFPQPWARGTSERHVGCGARGMCYHGAHDDGLPRRLRGSVRGRYTVRDPGSRRARRSDQGVLRDAAEHPLSVCCRGRTHRRLHRLRRRTLADAAGDRTRRSDRTCSRPRPRRRERRPGRHRDAELPRMDRRVRRDHVRRCGGGADERLVADRRDGVRPRRLRLEDRHRRRRSARTGCVPPSRAR